MADALIAIARAEGRKWYKLTPPTVVSTLELHSVMLDLVRREGDWEEWLAFLVEGIRVTAAGAVETAQRLATLFRDDRTKIESKGRRAGSALRVHEAIKARPILSMPEICRTTGLSFPAVSSAMDLLMDMALARELTGKRRNRLFVYDRYLGILNEGTAPPPP